MFHVNYKLFKQDQEEFKGKVGYFQLTSNQFEYGLFLQKELEVFSVSVYQWFHDLLEAATLLKNQSHVFIHNNEVPRSWIEMRKLDADVITICEVHADQSAEHQGISCEELEGRVYPNGSNNFVPIKLFNGELLEKSQEYVHLLKRLNPYNHPAILELETLMAELEVTQINYAI